jgi:DNA-binding NtrC family response regulator
LRERVEDIPVLAAHFTEKYARPGQQPPRIDAKAMELLLAYPWPGNVRQLENAIERACVTTTDGEIAPKHLPTEIIGQTPNPSPMAVDLTRPLAEQLAELTAAFEERYLRKAMKRSRGHVGRCAQISGMSRRSITDKLAHYNIKKNDFKKL